MDRPGVRQVPEGSGEQGKMEKTGCKIICGAPTILAVKGLMMMMMISCPEALVQVLAQALVWARAMERFVLDYYHNVYKYSRRYLQRHLYRRLHRRLCNEL